MSHQGRFEVCRLPGPIRMRHLSACPFHFKDVHPVSGKRSRWCLPVPDRCGMILRKWRARMYTNILEILEPELPPAPNVPFRQRIDFGKKKFKKSFHPFVLLKIVTILHRFLRYKSKILGELIAQLVEHTL